MKHLIQQNPYTCGQTCVAMLLDVSEEKVIRYLGKGRTSLMHLVIMLSKKYTTKKRVLARYNPKMPKLALLTITWNDGRKHWVIKNGEFIYDPVLASPYLISVYQSMVVGRITSWVPLRRNAKKI